MLTAMEEARLYSVVKAQVVSEKANFVAKNNTVVFNVLPSANKHEIKFAVEQVFDVKVKSVCTLNVKGKVKRTGARIGRRQDWKKDYVTLMPGQSLNLADGTGE